MSNDLAKEQWNQAVSEAFAALDATKGKTTPAPIMGKGAHHPNTMPLCYRMITEDMIRLFASAIGDANPLWVDEEYAAATPLDGIVAPPMCEVMIAEAASVEGLKIPEPPERDQFGTPRVHMRQAGQRLAEEIKRCTGIESRTIALGRLQRGGAPTVFDRLIAAKLGVAAVEFMESGRFGVMAAVRGLGVEAVPLSEVVGRIRGLDPDLYELAQVFS
jgi:6-phosphofructokinase